jgi:hypothetical protein
LKYEQQQEEEQQGQQKDFTFCLPVLPLSHYKKNTEQSNIFFDKSSATSDSIDCALCVEHFSLSLSILQYF